MYRRNTGLLEVLLIHPGGPFWVKKDVGCWSIPKGECLENEAPFDAARREFQEETGLIPQGEFWELAEIKQTGGKRVKAWAFEGDCDPTQIHSNTFLLEFPPRSGKFQSFPEVDRAAWFSIPTAKQHIVKGQIALLEELEQKLTGVELIEGITPTE